MAQVYLAVDLGGTRIRAARCRAEGTIEARTEALTQADQGVEAVIARIESAVRSMWPTTSDTTAAIGLVAPGPIDPWTGVILTAPNLPGMVNLPLRDRLGDIFNVPVFIGNDANLAGLAEWRFGAARGYTDMVYLTVSTGIGGGVVSNGRLLLGSRGLAAELGHITIDRTDGVCNCGNVGCLEWLASGTAIVRQIVERLRDGEPSRIADLVHGDLDALNVEVVAQAALQGDAVATAVLNKSLRALGLGVTSLLHMFNPSIVVIGGGVSNLGARLFDSVRATVKQHVMDPRYICPIVPAHLSGDVGLLGALALALDPPPQRQA